MINSGIATRLSAYRCTQQTGDRGILWALPAVSTIWQFRRRI
jgi:hypothetical protein